MLFRESITARRPCAPVLRGGGDQPGLEGRAYCFARKGTPLDLARLGRDLRA
jgi:hypothetical protein